MEILRRIEGVGNSRVGGLAAIGRLVGELETGRHRVAVSFPDVRGKTIAEGNGSSISGGDEDDRGEGSETHISMSASWVSSL